MGNPNSEYPNLALIRAGIQNRFPITLRKFTVMVRPLSVLEETQISEAVASELSSMPSHLQLSMRQTASLAIKKLEMAQTSDVGKSDGKMFASELSQLSAGEIDALFKEYIAGCDKLSPTREQLGQEKLVEIVDALKKSTQDMEMILTELSFFQLRDICRHLLTQAESPKAS